MASGAFPPGARIGAFVVTILGETRPPTLMVSPGRGNGLTATADVTMDV